MSITHRDPIAGTLAELERTGAPDARRHLLEDAVQAQPADPRLLTLLAAEYVHAGELDRAEAAYLGALQRAPDLAIARFQLGLLQLTSARPAAARATWAPLDTLDEANPLRLFKSGLELMAQDRFEEARRLLARGIAQNGTNPALNRDMQLVLERMPGAQAGAADAGRLAPSSAQSHFLVSKYQKAN